MNQEQPPSYKDINEVLNQTRDWINNWHNRFRQTHKLTWEVLMGGEVELSAIGGGGRILVEDTTPYLWRIVHNFESNFGTTSLLHLERLSPNPNHPCVVMIAYELNRFGSPDVITFGWDKETSIVLSENLEMPYGRIDRMYVVTKLPDQQHPQRLKYSFIHDHPGLYIWTTDLTYIQIQDEKITTEHRQCNAALGKPTMGYSPELNPIPYIENFARHKAKLPLISND